MKKDEVAGIVSSIVLVVLFLLFLVGKEYLTVEAVDFTVQSKERISTGSGGNMKHKYLVYTEGETFENTDTLWHLKYNSSDLHGTLKDGERYSAKVNGWRVGFLSMYRNIIEVRKKGEVNER